MSETTTTEPWMKWVPVVEALLRQAYYRVLSFVSFHASIDESVKAIEYLTSTKGMGKIYPVIPGRVYRWDGAEVFPGITMNVWVFGSPTRKKNTVYARVGWWTLTLLVKKQGLAA